MKRFSLTSCLALALIASAVVLWLVLPPLNTRQVPIPEAFLAWLREDHPEDLAQRLSDPLEVSLRLLYHGPTDAIDTRGMTINVVDDDEGNRIVTIDDRYIEDDSVSRSYSRIVLKSDGLIWVPIEHHVAHQGRGVLGWTTGPTS